jgi:hypothetical protein
MAQPMPSSVNKKCRACGGSHILYLPAGEPTGDVRRYEFICPTTGKASKITLTSDERWQQVEFRPRGSIVVYLARK